ncbi:coiled-coil domain-containing protein [Leptothrix discophora]|uniref:MotA/TolQ/ExbB proton channel domain-containing protein n=1 Tax=Leptothrix discophora TaxID=89 RepID=A0ABT9G3E9_LEPDI|nr:hypothetical protein [Leptothrix discophora]MDP4300998.1 hypothetical protein [Leptothrix discophora]
MSLPRTSTSIPASGGIERPWSLVACVAVTVAYLIGMVWLFDRIVALVNGSANPAFAIFILVMTCLGQGLAIVHAVRLAADSKAMRDLRGAMVDKAGSPFDIQRTALGHALARSGIGRDVLQLFGVLRAERSRGDGLDAEILSTKVHEFELAVGRRTLVPGHIASTLIGLGLFGTFLGLIVTLKEVASLIGLFSGVGNADSADTMSRFFLQMSGPLGGMGEAFVASLFGLGGSMVNSLQMLTLRRLQAETVATAEKTFLQVAELLHGRPARQDGGGNGVVDTRLARLQLEEISGLRSDLSRQTEAILVAASKMRLASDAMQAMSALAEKRLGSDETRAHIEKVASVVAQRLETMARKFDDLQLSQNQVAAAIQSGSGTLADIAMQAKFIADHNNSAVRELVSVRDAIGESADQSRQHLTKTHAELRAAMHQDLAALLAGVGETSRELREQTMLIGGLGANTLETNLTLHALDGRLRELAERIQPQLVEMIARLEASSQNDTLAARYELSGLNRKLDDLSEELLRQQRVD